MRDKHFNAKHDISKQYAEYEINLDLNIVPIILRNDRHQMQDISGLRQNDERIFRE